MFKSIILTFLAAFILTTSMVLPLGDFDLITELPGMYHSYTVVKAGDPDVLDFIGDYLLGGKDFLGHNKKDAPVKDGSLQFHHQPFVSIFYAPYVRHALPHYTAQLPYRCMYSAVFHTSCFYGRLLRPPLA